jgi:hypothetical protein
MRTSLVKWIRGVSGISWIALRRGNLAEEDSNSKFDWNFLEEWMEKWSWILVILTCGRTK